MNLPKIYRNPVSLLGTIIAIIAFSTIIFLIFITNFFDVGSVYFDLFTFIVVPGILFFGLLLISIGMYRTWRRNKRGVSKYPEINLNDKKQRNAATLFTIITIIFVIMTVLGTSEAIHYSESVNFCGTLCHRAMNPEYTAYQHSPHARVKCAECHVGEGADYFIQAKISGLRQLYKYILNSYNKPVYTPIHNLRPASQTCEKCHWPEKFYTHNMHREKYYLADSLNTEWDILLSMKIGPENQAEGFKKGIHWHINPDVTMEYKANPKRDTIYWVKYTNNKTGKVSIYQDETPGISADSLIKIPVRTMDCMDCHNRPSHEFRSPSHYVNDLFAANSIPASVPWLKSAAMEALKNPYSSNEAAAQGIQNGITKFYTTKYPDIYNKHKTEIDTAITAIQSAYTLNAFPEMKVTYLEYPRHIGHLETNGCFRCHNEKHKTKEGKVISKDCSLCHSILGQGKVNSMTFSSPDKSLKFEHPFDIGNVWKESNCMECHEELYK